MDLVDSHMKIENLIKGSSTFLEKYSKFRKIDKTGFQLRNIKFFLVLTSFIDERNKVAVPFTTKLV